MKKTLLILAFLLLTMHSYSQMSLPYYCGFDDAAQQAGWMEFRLGETSTFNWVNNGAGYSLPNSLHHDLPLGSSDTTIDWYVSPALDFTGGGVIDSIMVKIYSITGSATAADELGIYLLSGSNDPGMATSITKVADLTNMTSSSGLWADTGNFMIPATANNSYIGIKYRSIDNWFVVDLDNITINGLSTGIKNTVFEKIKLFPIPASDKLNIELPPGVLTNKIFKAVIYDNQGRLAYSELIENDSPVKQIKTTQLKSGNYMMRILDESVVIYEQEIVISKR
jgi:hypothetical protein